MIVIALGLATGALFSYLGVPLPWVLGPLLASAAAALYGAPLLLWEPVLRSSQVVIGAAVGHGFTASFLVGLVALLPWMIGFALWSVAVAAACSLLLARLAPLDRQSALLANLPGGVAEMAFIGDANRGGASAISLIQVMRVTSLVVVLPLLLATVVEGTGNAVAPNLTGGAFSVGTALVLAAGYAGGWSLSRLGMKNAFIVAALLISLADNLIGLLDANIPSLLFVAAQIVLGLALGARFRRREMRRLPRVMVAGLGVSVLTSAVIIVSALALAWLLGHSPAVLVLAGAPGGVAEMVLTAAALGLPVPEIVAFQMVRIIIVNTSAGFLASFWSRFENAAPPDSE